MVDPEKTTRVHSGNSATRYIYVSILSGHVTEFILILGCRMGIRYSKVGTVTNEVAIASTSNCCPSVCFWSSTSNYARLCRISTCLLTFIESNERNNV